MISVSVWFPLRIPRSVETSKMTAWVGIFSAICLQENLNLRLSSLPRSVRPQAYRRSSRFSIARPSILAKLDLPEPKNPETQMAMPSWGLLRCSRRSARESST